MSPARKSEPDARVRSMCPGCGVGCGFESGSENGGIASIRGDADHPANLGRFCPKPAGLPEAANSANRLTHPLRRTKGSELAFVSRDAALEEIAGRLRDGGEPHGPSRLPRRVFEARAVISSGTRARHDTRPVPLGRAVDRGQPELSGAAVRLEPVAAREGDETRERRTDDRADKTGGRA